MLVTFCTSGSAAKIIPSVAILFVRLEKLRKGNSMVPGTKKIETFKAGFHMKAVFWLGSMVLMQISRLRFKQSTISILIPHIYILGRFVNFLVIFRYIWR